ncbi:unnamed protein product [marine sediment metagenome]|uniref:Uncharacterized protein n=1 Tax=marine sediment metagenome TaxID=412755 RepID=X0TW64_9ZZZZ
MGSQLYRCFACDSEPFHAPKSNPSCLKCNSPDAVASIVEIHMISKVKGGPISNKYKPLCCNTRPLYFTNSEGGVTCLTCLGIIRKVKVEEAEEVEKAPDLATSKQAPQKPNDVTTEDLPASLVGPHPEPLDSEEDNIAEEVQQWEASDKRSNCGKR